MKPEAKRVRAVKVDRKRYRVRYASLELLMECGKT